jgi:chromosome partitioning protein
MSRIAVFNQKGGVGKTTTVLNLGAALQRLRCNNLIIDMDPQGHLTQILEDPITSVSKSLFDYYQNHKPLEQLVVASEVLGHIIPSHKELIKVDSTFGKGPAILNRLRLGLETLQNSSHYDNVIMDCCPYVGVLSLNAMFAADLVIIPISSDFLSLQGAQKVEHTLRALEKVLKRRVPRRYLLTNYDKRRGMTFEVQKQAFANFGEDLLKTTISDNVSVAESPQHKKDIFSYHARSTGAQDYQSLASELISEQLIKTPDISH